MRHVPRQHYVESPEGFVVQAAALAALGLERLELAPERRRVARLVDPKYPRRVRTHVDVVVEGVAPETAGLEPQFESCREGAVFREVTVDVAVVGVEPPDVVVPVAFVFDQVGGLGETYDEWLRQGRLARR